MAVASGAMIVNEMFTAALTLLRHKGWMQTKQAQDLEAIANRLVEEGGDPTDEEFDLINAFYQAQADLLMQD